MAWEGSTRSTRYPDDWPLRRLRVLRRDGYRCQHRDREGGPKCGALANQVDHIIPGDDHSLTNLQSLCRDHHAKKSSAEGLAARRLKMRRRPSGERHPGLIP